MWNTVTLVKALSPADGTCRFVRETISLYELKEVMWNWPETDFVNKNIIEKTEESGSLIIMQLKVVIADDDEVVVFIHKAMVNQSGLSNNPVILSNGRQVLDFLALNHLEDLVYLLLLDINMPVMDGWEFLETLQNTPFADKVHVVMVTSSVNRADKEKAGQFTQVIYYIEKPVTTELCAVLKELNEIKPFFKDNEKGTSL